MSAEGWKSLLDVIAVVLLFFTFACGAAALVFGNIVNRRQAAQLRDFDRDLTAAKGALSTQQERAAKADARVAELEKAAADAKSEMSKQEVRAADAEKQLLELQQRTAPRRVSSGQRAKFIETFVLKGEVNGAHLTVGSLSGVNDAEDFANDIAGLLSSVGYSVEVSPSAFKIDIPKGIQVIFGENRTAEAEAIAQAIRVARIQIPALDAVMSQNQNQLTLYIGIKLPE